MRIAFLTVSAVLAGAAAAQDFLAKMVGEHQAEIFFGRTLLQRGTVFGSVDVRFAVSRIDSEIPTVEHLEGGQLLVTVLDSFGQQIHRTAISRGDWAPGIYAGFDLKNRPTLLVREAATDVWQSIHPFSTGGIPGNLPGWLVEIKHSRGGQEFLKTAKPVDIASPHWFSNKYDPTKNTVWVLGKGDEKVGEYSGKFFQTMRKGRRIHLLPPKSNMYFWHVERVDNTVRAIFINYGRHPVRGGDVHFNADMLELHTADLNSPDPQWRYRQDAAYFASLSPG